MLGQHSLDYRTMLHRWQALFESVAVDPTVVGNPQFRHLMAEFDRDLVALERIDPVGWKLLRARIDVQTGVRGVNIERM